MATKSLAARLLDQIRRCAGTREGNVAVIFALVSFPVIGMVGAAVDYSRANAVKADMQSALDATALMVAKNAGDKTTDELEKMANSYFAALFKNSDATATTIGLKYNKGQSTVALDGTSLVHSDFMGIMGFQKIPVTANSMATWGTTKLRVALALDNTLSMLEYNKIGALKAAATNLLVQLEAAAKQNGDVLVAIIPFATTVNVGKTNKDQNWLNWSYYSHADKSKWAGCVFDRDQDHDVKNTAPDITVKSTLFPAIYTSSFWLGCPVEMMGLSYNWTALKSKVAAMFPTGMTNQTIGLAWAWQALSQGAPLNAPAPEKDSSNVIVFMTDGLNTMNRWTTDPAKIDARTAKACANIKAAGIILYTVQVKGNGDPTSKILQNCASEPNKFFALDSGTQLVTTFNTIATQLSQLRLSK